MNRSIFSIVMFFLWVSSFLIFSSRTIEASAILAGPMLGHVTESTAVVWVRSANSAEVEALATQSDTTVVGLLEKANIGGFVRFHFRGLIPGRPVHVTVRARLSEDLWDTYDLAFTTPKPPEAFGTLRIAFGSCSQDSRHPYVPVYEAMAFEQPDLALFVGDNSYFVVGEGDWSTSGPIGDWNSSQQMIERHMRTRTNPYLQRLLRSVPTYGIWDDHDYGPNNSDREFKGREIAHKVFRGVWANPDYGTPSTPGIFSKFRRGPVDIFLMDGRYHKYVSTSNHPDVPREHAAIWGTQQLKWLMDELRRSTAPVKVIANGTQVISKNSRGEGHFNEAPEELERLLIFLRENRIGGVIFLTGDRHYTEVMRLTQDGGPDILEFTSSPFQQGQAVTPLELDHGTNIWAMHGNSYGLVTISVGRDGEGSVRFEMRDANNYVPLRDQSEYALAEFALDSLLYD